MLDTYRYKVDFSNIEDYREIHQILKESLDFPDYYGGNLDALFDCLTDMLGDISIIEIHGIEKLKKFDGYDKRLLKVFYDAKFVYNEFSGRFLVTIVHENGRREEIG
jgi:ribonuclease inhibitor